MAKMSQSFRGTLTTMKRLFLTCIMAKIVFMVEIPTGKMPMAAIPFLRETFMGLGSISRVRVRTPITTLKIPKTPKKVLVLELLQMMKISLE